MFMFQSNKQKKKDKLWFACKTLFQKFNQDNDVMPSVQPQLRLPQRLRRPHPIMDQRDLPPPQYTPMKCCKRCCSSMSSIVENSQQQLLYPAKTLQCANSHKCIAGATDDASYPMEMESGSEEMSIEQDYEIRTGGCYYESCGDNSTDCNEGDDNDHRFSSWSEEQTEELITHSQVNWQRQQMLSFHQISTTNNNNNNNNNNSSSRKSSAMANVLPNYCCAGGDSVSNESSVGKCPNLLNQKQNCSLNNNNNAIVTPIHSTATSKTTIAASVFRNCCRGSQSNESSIGSYPYPQNNRNHTLNYNNNNNNISKSNYNYYDQKATTTNDSSVLLGVKALFEALMKKLTASQLDTLCQVVETSCGTDANTGSAGWRRQNHHHRTRQSSDCVLVARETIGDEEPNVIACRLFSWPDLKTSTELKRIPMCPNGREKVYVCCNPAHWNRILVEEAVPPPYQESVMDRLKPEDRAPSENSKDDGLSKFGGNSTGLRVQIPESFTTNGEDHSSPSPTWCQIHYWELAQRVGERYEVKNSTINIYSEGSGGMDLKVLAENKIGTAASVQKTRQKIGLGITLSQEADGVWLYNRSEAPIFIHSPTLNDDCRHVCKVPPGYCLNAFDKNRARTQKLVSSPQAGPIDTFSMKISFVKGWGTKYVRTDITACPCWLEVLFSRR